MEEKRERSDRRVVKTKRAIRNAFIKLLSEKEFNDITIKDIADEADIDRKTLYNHYSGIYEIREELENNLVTLLEQSVQELDFKKSIHDPQHIFEILTEILNTNLELYGHLMQLDARSHIVRKIKNMLKNYVRQALTESDLFRNGCDLDLCTEYVTSGMLAVYQHWFNSDRSKPLDEVSRKVGQLVLYGLHYFKE